jgi:Holliday junction DNA helicase RuvA
MFSYIKGKIKSVNEQTITIENNNFGFEIFVPEISKFSKNQETELFLHLNWNQEQGPSLFGFETETQKSIFLLIISCSGIGPKMGINIMSQIGTEQFLEAVQSNDTKTLSSINGIGPKKAEQIVFSLSSKVGKLINSGIKIEGSQKFEHWKNLSDVLVSLNYSKPEIDKAMQYLRKNYTDKKYVFDELLRFSLGFLSKHI